MNNCAVAAMVPTDVDPEMTRMVRSLAGQLHARLAPGLGVDLKDLIQAGNVGLLKATRSFETGGGASLPVYAKFRIRGEMLDLVRAHLKNAASGGVASAVPELTEIAARADSSPQVPIFTHERAEIIREEVERLPDRYRSVVRLRYSKEMTLKEIGEILCVKESRASQLHSDAMARLRKALRVRGVLRLSEI